MRVKSRWNLKDRPRSVDDVASALAFISWRIAGNAVLEMENENYQTDTQTQRVAVIGEFLAFLIHVTDRLVYGCLEETARERLINAYAQRTADILADNLRDLVGAGEHRSQFIETLNRRLSDYAELSFDGDEPSFSFLSYLGTRVAEHMGPRDNRWVQDQVMEIEAPDALKTLKKALRDLVPESTGVSTGSEG